MNGRVSTSLAGDRTVHHLHDDDSGASASVLPSYGFNLFDLRLKIAGDVRPIVVSAPDFAANPSRPARSGFPLLFPFPGRIRDARFTFGGREYSLVANKAPHAIHGFAYDVAWDVVGHGVGDDGCPFVAGRFQISKNAPEQRDRWPSDGILEIVYTLRDGGLEMSATVENPSDRPLPWGFGVHSYFALPLDRREDRGSAKVVIDASRYWQLRDGLPTGERLSVDGTSLDYREGRSMDGLLADDALTGLGDPPSSVLIDAALGAEVHLSFDRRLIREVVVFTPLGPDGTSEGIVAVEPYTCMADPFALRDMGTDAGLRILAPGAREVFEPMTIEVRDR